MKQETRASSASPPDAMSSRMGPIDAPSWMRIVELVGGLARREDGQAALDALRSAIDADAVVLHHPHADPRECTVSVSPGSGVARRSHVLRALRPAPATSRLDDPVDVALHDPSARKRLESWGIVSHVVTEHTQATGPSVRLEIYTRHRFELDPSARSALRVMARELAGVLQLEHVVRRRRSVEAFVQNVKNAGPTLVHVYVPARGDTVFANGRCQEFFAEDDLRPRRDRAIERNRHPWLNVVVERDRERLHQQLRATEAVLPGHTLEGVYRFRPDGGARDFHVWTTRISRQVTGGDEELMVTALDVTRERELERHVERVEMHERRALGRELHDGICQDLIGLRMTVDRHMRAGAEQAHAVLGEVSISLDECLKRARKIARGLQPIQISGDDLPSALQELAETTERRFGVPVHVDFRGTTAFLPAEEALQLYWITRESVLNAARHAAATRITVGLAGDGDRVGIRVADDGCGFVLEDAIGTSMGLRILERRARMIGAELRIDSASGHGTTVLCDFEIDGSDDHDE